MLHLVKKWYVDHWKRLHMLLGFLCRFFELLKGGGMFASGP